MSITVIEQTTAERYNEIETLFQQIQPLLDDGYSYMGALVHIGRIPKRLRSYYYNRRWFQDLKTYGASKGYPYHKYSGKGRK